MQKTVLHPQFLHMVGEEFGVFSRLENSSHLSTGTHPRLGGGGSSWLQTTQNRNIKKNRFW